MSASSYDEALRRVLAHEGGYTNHPADPGGPTNFGITIFDYRRYVKPGASAADVKAMKLAEAKAIYRSKYWNALRCDDLPGGLDYAVFDYGVNSGIGRAAKVLQRMLGLPDDGHITDAVLAAIRRRDAKDLVVKICDERLAFLKGLKTWPVFGAGWGRRVAEVKAAALVMADSMTGAEPSRAPVPLPPPASSKGIVPINKSAQKTAAGTVAAGGAAAAQAAHQAGASAATVLVILVTAAVLGAAAWFGFRWWRARAQHAPVPFVQGQGG